MRTRLACTVWRMKKANVRTPLAVIAKKTGYFNSNNCILLERDDEEIVENEFGKLHVKLEEEFDKGETFQILNELVVDRGPSPYMSQLELFVDDVHLVFLFYILVFTSHYRLLFKQMVLLLVHLLVQPHILFPLVLPCVTLPSQPFWLHVIFYL